MADATTHTVILALPEDTALDWSHVSQILAFHGRPAAVPLTVFPVRHRRLTAWFGRWSSRHLLEPARRHGAVTTAAGGRLSRLNLQGLATAARTKASTRWWTWHTHIERTTPTARPWADFLAEHRRDPAKVTLTDARRRFEAQPRITAMLAYNSYPAAPHTLDPYEVDAYQGGEAVYVALHWQHALVGDALVHPDGRLLQPASESIPDRLRYLADAGRVVHTL